MEFRYGKELFFALSSSSSALWSVTGGQIAQSSLTNCRRIDANIRRAALEGTFRRQPGKMPIAGWTLSVFALGCMNKHTAEGGHGGYISRSHAHESK